jgi:ABC-type uncharacterized transport system auxiliary subunit
MNTHVNFRSPTAAAALALILMIAACAPAPTETRQFRASVDQAVMMAIEGR